jgi:hypothetical protein
MFCKRINFQLILQNIALKHIIDSTETQAPNEIKILNQLLIVLSATIVMLISFSKEIPG